MVGVPAIAVAVMVGVPAIVVAVTVVAVMVGVATGSATPPALSVTDARLSASATSSSSIAHSSCSRCTDVHGGDAGSGTSGMVARVGQKLRTEEQEGTGEREGYCLKAAFWLRRKEKDTLEKVKRRLRWEGGGGDGEKRQRDGERSRPNSKTTSRSAVLQSGA